MPSGLARRRIENVEIVALNPFMDLALLKLPSQKDLKYSHVVLGSLDDLNAGDGAFAVGNPLGLERYARGLPLVRALAGFNLGVELGQAIAIGLVLPIMFMIGRLARAVLVYRYASLAVAAAGAYWLAERLHLG